MLTCNCKYHIKTIGLLKKYNTVGTRFTNNRIGPHYSGNFWWFNSEYIRTKSRHIGRRYLDPESWLLKGMKKGKHLNIDTNGSTSLSVALPRSKWKVVRRRKHKK